MSFEKVPNFLGNLFTAEMNGSEQGRFRFNSFLLDAAERELLRGKETVPLAPKSFDTLLYLVKNSGHLVTKDELMSAVWPDSFVEEGNLSRTIHILRKTLGEDHDGNKFIKTVPTKGYRFVADVTVVDQHEPMRTIEPATVVPAADETESTVPAEPTETPHAAARPKVKEQRIRFVLAGGATLCAVLIGLWLFVNARSKASSTAGGATSIAVLPVRSLIEQDRDPIYELGIADALIARLSPTKDLVVRQLDAVKAYNGVEKNAVDIGREQKVDYVLASNYQVADKKVRITAQLINVSTGAVEDVFRFDESGPDRFAVQDAAAIHLGNSVLKRLNREIANATPKRYTTNEEAYSLYLQGTQLTDSRDHKAIEKAVEYFERAVTLDPNFALAYAGMANAHTGLSIHGGETGPDEYHKAKDAIERALAIDDTVAEAHTYMGELKSGIEWDFEGAEKEFKRGIELNPSSSAAHRMYALMLGCIGRVDEAVSEIRTAIDLDPASALNHKLYTHIAYFGRRYDEAIAEGRLSLEMEPQGDIVSWYIVDAYFQKGEDGQAFDWFVKYRERVGDPAKKIDAWRRAYTRAGWHGVRERQINLTLHDEKKDSFQALYLARLYSMQGDIERAFTYLDKAFAMRLWGDVKLIADPAFDPLRSDPRYALYLAKLNIKQ